MQPEERMHNQRKPSMLRSSFSKLPTPIRKGLLSWADRIKREVFLLSDPYFDLARLGGYAPPIAILDVGAHHGETVEKLIRIFPGIPLHAIEPTPASVAVLRRKFRGNPNVIIHDFAISDRDGTSQFFLNSNEQTNSLLENGETNNTILYEQCRHIQTIDVTTRTLDGFCRDVLKASGNIMVKADVQGAELQLIRGGHQSFLNRISAFFSEVSLANMYESEASFFDVNSLLTKECNMVLYQIYRNRADAFGKAIWADAMWISQELLAYGTKS